MPKGVYDHYKIRGVKRPVEVGRNISASMKGKNTYPRTEEHKNKIGISAKITHNRPEVREKKRQVALEFWEDLKNREERVKAIIKGSRVNPNKPEKFLDKLFQDLFPNQIKYTGDGKDKNSIIGGRCPDFIFTDGQKKIVEHFGDYHHGEERMGIPNKQHEQERMVHFAKFGYQTLIIWQHELEDVEKLTEKILNFRSI